MVLRYRQILDWEYRNSFGSKNHARKISASNDILGRAICDKLPERIFENLEFAQVKRGQCQNFQKSRGGFIPKVTRKKHVIIG